MTNKINPIIYIICVVLTVSAVLILHGLANSSNAKAAQTINFYLPVHSNEFPRLVETLEQALSDQKLSNIKIITADYWQSYQQNIRHGRIGIYYAAPHFTSWAIKHHQFQPLLKTQGNLKYVIASQRSNPDVFEIRDLEGKTICTRSALNLDYLLIIKTFEKSLQPANIQVVESTDEQMNNTKTLCSAFSISEFQFSEQQTQAIKHIRLAQGLDYTNYGISLHPSLSSEYANRLTDFFQQESILEILKPLIKRNSSKVALIPANSSDYPADYSLHLEQYWQNH